jgi:hypothetical protein
MKSEKEFDTVKTFRKIKDEISKEIKGMTFEQLTAYLESRKLTTQEK